MLARACGKTNVHNLEPEDLCALTVEASAMARVPLAGTDYIPGVSEERTLAEIKRLLERHVENPIDYLESSGEAGSRGRRARAARRERAREDPRSTPSTSRAAASPTRRTSRSSRTSTCSPRRRARTSTGSRTSTLLEEDGTPAVFDRYSNSFLKIYFPIPPGREDEIARKVLITHLQSGNSYGIALKERHCKFPQPELGPWVEGSRTVGADWQAAACSRAGSHRQH